MAFRGYGYTMIYIIYQTLFYRDAYRFLMVYRCVFWLFIAWFCSETPWTALSQRCGVSSSDVRSYSCRCIPWTWFVLKLSRSPEGSDVSAVASYPRCVHFLPWLHDRRTLWTLLQCHFAGMLVMLIGAVHGRQICRSLCASVRLPPLVTKGKPVAAQLQCPNSARSSRSRSTWGRGLTLDSRSWVISCLKESMENG